MSVFHTLFDYFPGTLSFFAGSGSLSKFTLDSDPDPNEIFQILDLDSGPY